MSITKERKQELIEKFGEDSEDTGSPQVQIAILTERIKNITEHLKGAKQDHSSRRGLLKLVSRRKNLLKYLKKHDEESYKELIAELGIRK
ncbi:MAG TPA: 30S ribosomal protein S15 [bacterium]|nr:30S ribosomal protein S15 [bacterium]